MAKNIEKYLRAQNYNEGNLHNEDTSVEGKITYDMFKINSDGNLLYKENVTVFTDTNLESFEIYQKNNDGFIRCYMKFKTGRQFDFIIGTYAIKTQEVNE